MVYQPTKNIEGERPLHPEEGKQRSNEQVESGELRHAVDTSLENLEGLGLSMNAEVKEKSEKVGESQGVSGPRKDTSQAAKKVSKVVPESASEIKAKLLQNLPSEKRMVKDIENTLSKEMKVLRKRANMAIKLGNAFEFTNIIAKIREMKNTIANLAHATYEMIRNIWLKIVHGIS